MNTTILTVIQALLLTVAVTLPAEAGKYSEYLSAEEYYTDHPDKVPLRDALSKAVNSPAVAIAATGEVSDTIRIAVLYPGIQLSDYWRRSVAALQGRLNELGISYQLQIRHTRPGTEQLEQEQQLRELLGWDPDYLIYTLDTPSQRSNIERLVHRRRPKLILQNMTTPLRAWGDKQPFLYTGFDHIEGANLLARYYRRKFPQGSEYGVLFSEKGVVSDMRGKTFIDAIGSFHTLKDSYYTHADQQSAYQATKQMLAKDNNIRYIYVCTTDLAIGATRALEELGREDVVINGWGGGLNELELLQNGKLDMVLMRMNDDSSVAIAEAIKRDRQGDETPLIYTGEFNILDSSNSAAEISGLISRAFRYSR